MIYTYTHKFNDRFAGELSSLVARLISLSA